MKRSEELLLRAFDALGKPLAVFAIALFVVELIAQLQMHFAPHVARF